MPNVMVALPNIGGAFCSKPQSLADAQTCILNSHQGHTMCGSMANIQSAAAEIRRGKKRKKEERRTIECGPMPNLMVALPNIGGALCSTPQSLADAHY